MTQPEKSLGKRIAGFGVAGAALVGSLAACGGDSDNSVATTNPAAVEQETPNNGDANVAANIGELIVTPEMVNVGYCATIAEDSFSYQLDSENNVVEAGEAFDSTVDRSYIPQSIAALLPVDRDKAANGEEGYRAWSDAVSTPLLGNKEAVNKEVLARLCEDPLYLEHIITGFGQITGTNGETVASLNPWMSTDVSTIDDRAEDILWNTGVFNRTTQQAETLSNAEIISRMNSHEERAAYMIAMLERYFEAERFAENKMTIYHIGLKGPEVGGPGDLPEMIANEDADKQYKGNFIIFKYTNKDGRCIEVGLNLGDGRYAELVDGVCIQQGDVTTTTILNPPTETTEPTVPEPTVPEPTVPEPTVPEPTVPEPTVPETTLPDHDPSDGPPPEATIPAQPVEPTPGYNPGDAEENEGSQDTIADGDPAPNDGEPTEDGTQIEGTEGTGAHGPTVGEEGDGVTESPDPETSPTNPSYNPEDESTDYQDGEGNSDPEETEGSDDVNSGDPNPGIGDGPGGF